jgi:amino acid adenylation domain-containing protein
MLDGMTTDSQSSLVSGFLRSVRKRPGGAALELGEEVYTYERLWQYAGAITGCLRERLAPSETVVAVLANRSVAAYGGILGILASGRGYVPLNPKFPLERTLVMLQASGCETLVVGRECAASLQALLPRIQQRLTIITADEDWDPGVISGSQHRFVSARELSKTADPADPMVADDATAYLLFTSGSTGVPKGVAVSQANVRAYMNYAGKRFGINADDRCSQNFDLTFDLSVHDLFTCWNAGATLCPYAEQTLTPATLIDEKAITVWFSVPAVAMFASKVGLLIPRAFPSLRWSLFCGEALSSSLATAWQAAANNSILENLYGPTEATIAITAYRWDPATSPAECVSGLVPIGWPYEGQQVCVIDERFGPVQPGTTGELCLGGSQVTGGYWNDPEKTARSFIRLAHTRDKIWYRTGDFVRQDERGCIFYLGRSDFQVKVNGYRVELQEIDLALRQAAGTELAVAIPWPVSNGSATGVVGVLSASDPAQDEKILAICASRLPRYMVPQRIFHFHELPLNVNGKIDRGKITQMIAAQQ